MKIVIKVGGALMAQGISNLVEDLKNVVKSHQVIIVHGGGPQINELTTQLGKQPKIYDTPTGMKTRHTDQDQMDIVKMAIAGYNNKTLVESLRKAGINAFGFTGLDGGAILAERKEQILIINEKGKRQILHGDYSGKVTQADSKLLNLFIKNGYVPVIGCIASSLEGDAVNVDGDRAASAVAVAINADRYISLTDVEGVYRDLESKDVISHMTMAEAEAFMEKTSGGMKKKIFAALEALHEKVPNFVIYSGAVSHPISDVLEHNKGTIITQK
jgi:acetylglutamate/LysW-gamma-L-alpha-aminoadipate kinase